MATYEIVYSDELYHHGVKGMRWGHRKKQYYEAKQRERAIRRETSLVRKYGSEAEQQHGRTRYANAVARTVLAKGRLKRESTTDAKKADARERKAYVKAMEKHGVKGSLYDAADGKGSAIYDALKKEKGKKYADEIQKKADKRLKSKAVGSAIVAGVSFATAIGFSVAAGRH